MLRTTKDKIHLGIPCVDCEKRVGKHGKINVRKDDHREAVNTRDPTSFAVEHVSR